MTAKLKKYEAIVASGEIGEMIGREAIIENSSQVGNAAKMREALMALVGVIDKYDSGNPLWWNSGAKGVMPLKKPVQPSPLRLATATSARQVSRKSVSMSIAKIHLAVVVPCTRILRASLHGCR